MEIRNVGVIGAGTMGSGIAQVFSQAGYGVVMQDLEQRFVDKGMAVIAKGLDRLVGRGKMTEEDKTEVMGRIQPTTRLEDFADVDLTVEAATEDVGIKLALFKKLDGICKDGCLLTSNTSSISLTKIAAATRRPGHVIGMHFFNPVPVMKLVEIVRALQTADETCAVVEDVSKKLGKDPVTVKDSYGFVGNRILLPMINEAINCVYEGVAPPEAVDEVMKLGMNHPMGPLALADLIGLDVCLHILETLYQGFEDPKFRPSPLLKQMVDAGYLGRKSGRGFYGYEAR